MLKGSEPSQGIMQINNKPDLFQEHIIPLSDETFRLLRDLIKNYCGIYFDDTSKYLLERRLSRRIGLLNLNDFKDYYRFLLYDSKREEELSAIMDILTVNETYFFREPNLLKAFSEEILPEIRERNQNTRRLRIWSGGCSTGEEPYTIAMLILEDGRFLGWDIQIIGSDISQRVLQVARKGIYGRNSFRQTDEYYIKKYFRQEAEGLWRIKDSVKELVNFGYLNLLDPIRTKLIETMDVIFCRNVLIYFDMESRKKVIDMFYNKLRNGGYLLLGHAESLLNITTSFTMRHLKNDVVYQKILPE